MASSSSSASAVTTTSALSDEELRFQSELEFVQCLCNPVYLQCEFRDGGGGGGGDGGDGGGDGDVGCGVLTGSSGSADLAQGQYFDEPAFVNYLAYLLYWKRPEYAHFIVYPQCLYFLELLVRTRAQRTGQANADADAPSPPHRFQQNEAFRKELGNPQFVDAVLYRQQFNHWRFNAPNRMADAMRLFEQQAQAAKDAASAAVTEAAPGTNNTTV
jgi:hypothetical protein